jgi:hypothetical protein|tara:strand:- start:649 stop:1011 length:363 start_codon:yes stop_codon:yes gene_type:complete
MFDQGISVSKKEAREKWMNHIGKNNPQLYVAIIKGIMLSQKFDAEVFVSKIKAEDKVYYQLDRDNQGGSNVLSVTWKTREIIFDHYNDSDGPTMLDFVEEIYLDKKTQKLYDSLNIGEFN